MEIVNMGCKAHTYERVISDLKVGCAQPQQHTGWGYNPLVCWRKARAAAAHI